MTAPALVNVTTQVAALAAQVATIGPLDNASLATLAPVILAAESALDAIDSAITATDAPILSSPSTGIAGVSGAGFAPALAETMMSQLAAMQNMGVLLILRGAVGRILFNLTNATG